MYHILDNSYLTICGRCYRPYMSTSGRCAICGYTNKDTQKTWETYMTGNSAIDEAMKEILKRSVKVDKVVKEDNKAFKSVLKTMVGGGHYQPDGTIQPIEFYKANPQLDFQQTNVIKYIYRFKEKNGLQDLLKVIHYTLIAAEFGYKKEDVDKFKQSIIDMFKPEEVV